MIDLAAIKINDKIYTGKRHAWIMKRILCEDSTIKRIPCDSMGFITDTGEFISDRFRAAIIAIECGQITEMKYPSMGLDSEEVCFITQEDIELNR